MLKEILLNRIVLNISCGRPDYYYAMNFATIAYKANAHIYFVKCVVNAN